MTEKRTHRSPEDRIAELQAKIEAIKARAERKNAKADPTVRCALVAVKQIDKALLAKKDGALGEAIGQARALLVTALEAQGVQVRAVAAAPTLAPRRGRKARALAAATP